MRKFLDKIYFIATFSLAIVLGLFIAKGFVFGAEKIIVGVEPHFKNAGQLLANSFSFEKDKSFEYVEKETEEKPISIKLGNIKDSDFVPPQDGKMIRINLETMKMDLYEDGNLVETITVLAKGKPGSYWETPGGEYEIQTKEERHLSSVGRAWMPWSMQFFGNFFIHGWPTYENGTPFPKGSGYSGGCIRLSDEDAEKLYEWSEIGTKVSIYSEKEISEENIVSGNYFKIDNSKEPRVSAQSYAVGDLETGEIILEKNPLEQRPIASITKLFTALTDLDVLSQRKNITLTKNMLSTECENGGFYVGEKVPTNELIYPLLLVSSNDAAEIIAQSVGRPDFIRYMNEKTQSIGLSNTYLEDPTGLSENNTSNTYDLLKLARYLYLYKPFILDVSVKEKRNWSSHSWNNTSQFLDNEGYKGGKRGYTDEALETNLGIFEINVGEFSKRTLGVVVLGSTDRYTDTNEILEYVKNNIYYQTIK